MTATSAVIRTAHLFPELDGLLIDLLTSLSRDEWTRRTIVPRWNVQQIAAHLLDTALRRLSLCRDGWVVPAAPIASARDLIDLVDRLNAQGVETLGRLSPEMLITLTATVVPQLAEHFASLDPDAPAFFPVSWAGDTRSPNWFDVAREYTERWHHQQQIRLAVGRPGIMTPHFYRPVLETFMRALPRTYANVDAPSGTICEVQVTGDSGGRWQVARAADRWVLQEPASGVTPASMTRVPEEIAWRVFTKGIPADEARDRISIDGDERLAAVVLGARAIIG